MHTNIQKRSTGFGAALILLALLLRLVGAVPGYAQKSEPALRWIVRQPVAGLSAPCGTDPVATTPVFSTTLPTQPTTETPILPIRPALTITQAEAALVSLRVASDCGYDPDWRSLLLQPLDWDLTVAEPTVLIYHSHACECYTKETGQDYTELVNCRTKTLQYNMVAVGDLLAALLAQAGIGVIHDVQLHDDPSYNDAYNNSRASVEQYLAQYPSIRLVLDLHRDAATNPDGSRYRTAATVDGQPAAQIMFVVGTDHTGSFHPDWQENLALALKMQMVLEQIAPGITRPIVLRGSRFNQDVSTGTLLVEVGASGNTLQEALRTVRILAQAIVALQYGTDA